MPAARPPCSWLGGGRPPSRPGGHLFEAPPEIQCFLVSNTIRASPRAGPVSGHTLHASVPCECHAPRGNGGCEMPYTLAEAARAIGMQKSTVLRAIKRGSL